MASLTPWNIHTPIDDAGNVASPELAQFLNEIVEALGGGGNNIAEEAKEEVVAVAETAEQLEEGLQTVNEAVVIVNDAVESVAADTLAAQEAANEANTALDGATDVKAKLDDYETRISTLETP